MPITITIVLYSIAWLILTRAIRQRQKPHAIALPVILALGLCAHGIGAYQQIVLPNGYLFSFFKIFSVFFWVANFLILVSSLRKPLHNLFLITLPISVTALLCSLYADDATVAMPHQLTLEVVGHILLSILAYSTMIIATVQALLLAYQNNKIRNKHPSGFARLLPPLQTMETLLFELLWIGQILLTLVIITGIAHIQDLAAQHLYHKIAFTGIAWVIYSILLWGRHFLGWRGNIAIRWTLSGFAFLFLAYLGTKLVLEIILA